MSSLGSLVLFSSQALCPSSLQTYSLNTRNSWSFLAIQKRLGHNIVLLTPNSGQCGGFGRVFSAYRKLCRDTICASAKGLKFEVRELSKKAANSDVVLDRISFDVKAGAVHGLVGPSGCGKTTVLRALNRLWEPSAGTVFYEGVDVTTMDVVDLRLRVGMVFQAAALFEGTVSDNVKYGPQLRGIDLSTERLQELLLLAGISEPSETFVKKSSRELSGGEAQRVSLARALANEPSVLLMDEPTSSLDPASTKVVEKSITSLVNNLGLTVILVSHDLEQINRVADVATMLGKGGVVLETGTPADLRSSENLVLTEFFTA